MTMNFKPGLTAFALTAGLGLFAAMVPVPVTAQETAPATPPATATLDAIQDFSIGAVDAKVQITEYASFTCPHCARFHDEVFAKLKTDYVDTGKVRFTLREVYFDRYGLWAAMMARCGGEMRYFGITDILFSTQSEWAASEDPAAVVANLKKIGRTAGMDDAALDACMKDGATAEALVAHFEKNFTADGVEGTPTFFINGVKHSNMGYEELKGLIDAELAK
ncbi:DsbA family protein [Paracoccaceae bacterium]